MKALIEAIEANDYRILWPPKIYIEGDKRVVEL